MVACRSWMGTDESEEHPLCDHARLPRDHVIQQDAVGLLRPCGLRVVPADGIVRQPARPFRVDPGGEILEGAHTEVAGRYPGQHSSRQGVSRDRGSIWGTHD